MAVNGCVVFAKDIHAMSRFYQAVLNMEVSESETSHLVLGNDSTELVIHGIPKKISDEIRIDNPPQLRAAAAIKPAYIVSSLDEVRQLCEANGGGLNPINTQWEIRGAKVLDGWDPEGNVIQFKQFV